jgi:hypothetical protein
MQDAIAALNRGCDDRFDEFGRHAENPYAGLARGLRVQAGCLQGL